MANNPGPVPLLFASDQSLSYLTGELPADYGFDPLGLLDPEGKSEGFVSPAWLQYSEVIHARCAALPCMRQVSHLPHYYRQNPACKHEAGAAACRWAMLGAAGCIAPEILATAGVIPQTPAEVTWFRSGVIPPAGVYSKCAATCSTCQLPCLVITRMPPARRA